MLRLPLPLRQVFMVALPALLLLAALTGIYWVQLYSSSKDLRQATLDNATLRAHQVNSAVSEAVSMLFFNADEAAQNLVAFYLKNPIERFSQQAEVLTQRFPEGALLQLAVIGPDGYLQYSNLGTDRKVFLGDREHFQVHVDKPDTGLFISKPLMGKVSKKWTIQFSRRIEQNGKFMGVLVLSLSPDYLYRTLEKLTRGSQDVVVIVRNSGEVLARSRDLEKAIGLKAAEDRTYLQSQPGDSGYFTAIGAIDQIERIYHWHHLTEHPAIVVLGLDMARLMAPVEKAIRQERIKGIVSTLAVWLTALLAVCLSLRMQANIRKRVEFEYAAMHDTLTGLKTARPSSTIWSIGCLTRRPPANGWRCCSLIWTASSRSTTVMATLQATSFCGKQLSGSRTVRAAAIWWHAWVVTSLSSSAMICAKPTMFRF